MRYRYLPNIFYHPHKLSRMQAIKTIYRQPLALLTISLAILIAFGMLAYVDEDTRQLADLFKTENLVALALYSVPALLVCSLLYRRFIKKGTVAASTAKAVIIGIPLTFTLIIVLAITVKELFF